MEESMHVIHVRGTRSVDPLSEHDLCTWIRNQCRREMQRPRIRRIVRELDIIRHHDVGQHRFQHAHGKETSWASIHSVIFVIVGTEEKVRPYHACRPCPKGK